jgi:hypothetical protein
MAVGRRNIFPTVRERLIQPISLHNRTQPFKKISYQLVLLFNVVAWGLRWSGRTSPLAKLIRIHMEGVAITT